MASRETCPEYIVALLEHIEAELERLYWNAHQEDYPSPFRNYGTHFKNNVFEIHAYDWSDEPKHEYNFKCGQLEVSWYKRLGRDTEINLVLPPGTVIRYFNKCMESLGDEWDDEWLVEFQD